MDDFNKRDGLINQRRGVGGIEESCVSSRKRFHTYTWRYPSRCDDWSSVSTKWTFTCRRAREAIWMETNTHTHTHTHTHKPCAYLAVFFRWLCRFFHSDIAARRHGRRWTPVMNLRRHTIASSNVISSPTDTHTHTHTHTHFYVFFFSFFLGLWRRRRIRRRRRRRRRRRKRRRRRRREASRVGWSMRFRSILRGEPVATATPPTYVDIFHARVSPRDAEKKIKHYSQ